MWQWLPSNVYNKFDILKFDLYGHGKSINPLLPSLNVCKSDKSSDEKAWI